MSYLLYGSKRSGSLAVELALAEVGVDYELRDVDLATDQQRTSGYQAINPQRKLPTLVFPDGELMTESAAILLSLAARHPEAGLMPPSDGPEYPQAMRWLLFVATEIYPIVEINDYPDRFSPGPTHDDAVREIARETWRRRWLVVEQAIAGDPWMLAGGFSLVDIYIAVVSRWAQQDAWRPDNLPKVERIAGAVTVRPGMAVAWSRHYG